MKTIVIIEDDPGINELISDIIKVLDYQTINFLNANDALDWLKKNSAFLIVLDYGLPDMNGVEFVRELKAIKQVAVPFIVTTGQGDERIAVDMMKLGAKDYIVKDINFLDMIPLILKRVSKEIENEIKLIETQEFLKQRESYLTAIIENLPGLIWLKDKEGKFLLTNTNFIKSIGKKSSQELLGCTDLDIWPTEIAVKYMRDDKNVISLMKNLHVEEQILDMDNNKWFETFKTPIIDNKKNVIGTAGYSHEITERKQYEENLSKKIEELKFINSFMIDRELRMVELKKEINELLVKAGQEKRYD